MVSKIKCHYEVLGVERDVGVDELKKTYRKLALQFHPDKNLENVEEATAQFRLVQQAYEVLSDPQERAWYDKHREAILRGGLGKGDSYDDNSLDVFQYFNSSCYSGYGDDDQGFYAVFGKVFETLAEEDYAFMPDRKLDEEFPKFGVSTSDYDEVVGPFYAFWSSFCTSKSFVWEEKYDTREAPDRRSRRVMEAENKKLREAAKKERNEHVRSLVAFVKKRDKRVQAYKKRLEERHAEIEKKTREKREEDLRNQKRKMENYKEAGWSAMSGLENDLKQLEAHLDEHFGDADSVVDEVGENDDEAQNIGVEESELYYDDLYCVACNKTFKSDKAFSNHENSRKHKEMVALLAEEMLREEMETKDANGDLTDDNVEEDKGDAEEVNNEKDELLLSSEDEEVEQKQRLSKKQKKKRRQKVLADAEEDILAEEISEISLSVDAVSSSSKKQKRKAAKIENAKMKTETQKGSENGTNNMDGVLEQGTEKEETASHIEATAENKVTEILGEAEQTKQDLKDAAGNSKTKSKTQKSKETVRCNVCQRDYPSRNKLFEHIKQTGHALRVDPIEDGHGAAVVENDERGKKGKKKSRR